MSKMLSLFKSQLKRETDEIKEIKKRLELGISLTRLNNNNALSEIFQDAYSYLDMSNRNSHDLLNALEDTIATKK